MLFIWNNGILVRLRRTGILGNKNEKITLSLQGRDIIRPYHKPIIPLLHYSTIPIGAKRLNSVFLNFNGPDIEFPSGDNLHGTAITLPAPKHRRLHRPLGPAIPTANPNRDFLDNQFGAGQGRVFASDFKTKPQAIRHHGRQLADFQIHPRHARIFHIFGDGSRGNFDDFQNDSHLMHGNSQPVGRSSSGPVGLIVFGWLLN